MTDKQYEFPTHELVIMFWKDGQPAGILFENGKREIYKITRARKEDVSHLLGTINPMGN